MLLILFVPPNYDDDDVDDDNDYGYAYSYNHEIYYYYIYYYYYYYTLPLSMTSSIEVSSFQARYPRKPNTAKPVKIPVKKLTSVTKIVSLSNMVAKINKAFMIINVKKLLFYNNV